MTDNNKTHDSEPQYDTPGETMDETLIAALQRLDLLDRDPAPRFTRLTGGVSSDIWRVDSAGRTFCVKRALAKLRVAQDWYAPVARNSMEVAWIETAGRVVPDAVPPLLAHDPEQGLFAMAYLEPACYPLWKQRLRDGAAYPREATAVAERLVAIHRASVDDPALARRFASDHIFRSIRLEPYLAASARAHPELAEPLQGILETTAATRRCLVHGDVSPKNILIGPAGPVFLDAECAWYGDPAFDLAFCLNHLLLKCLWRPTYRDAYLACFRALTDTYLAGVDWEAPAALEARTATLLPGLLLARVDGKSPVEYLTEESAKNRVRRVAGTLLRHPVPRLAAVAATWQEELTR